MMRTVELWGNGGYYAVRMDDEGHMGIPAGREAWVRFARYAPDELIQKAIAAAEGYREHQAREVRQ